MELEEKMEKQQSISANKRKTISFYKYRAVFRENGDQTNFSNIVKFLMPHLDNNNYKVNIVSFNNFKNSIETNRKYIPQNEHLNGVYFLSFKRIFPRKKNIYQALEMFINIIRFLYSINKYRPDIVYVYGDTPLFIASLAKLFSSYKIVYDKRGDYIDELEKLGASKRKLGWLKKILAYSERKIEFTYVVSDTYKKDQNNSTIIPKYNYFDKNIFYYSEKEMLAKRAMLNLSNKFVFVYTGSSYHYQMVEETVLFFSKFNKVFKDSFFIVLTESDHNDFIKYFKKYNVSEGSYSVSSMTQKELCSIQMIADLAFLFRADLPLNRNSFPTKFAEYLANGIPVLTTEFIETIVPMIKNNGLGEIIDLSIDDTDIIYEIHKKYLSNLEVKQKCADYSNIHLQWQKKSFDHFKQIDAII
ncbi:hypothetical protein HN928_03140 [bacterium]|jgi:hypothetical protein|nr:hypothetical protein [bacterium]